MGAASVIEQFEDALSKIQVPCPDGGITRWKRFGNCVDDLIDIPELPNLPGVDVFGPLFIDLFGGLDLPDITQWFQLPNLFDLTMPDMTFFNFTFFDSPKLNRALMEDFACNFVKGALKLVQFSEWKSCPANVSVDQGKFTDTCQLPPKEDEFRIMATLKMSFPKGQIPQIIGAFNAAF